jgi:hypothetical protein
MGRFGQLNLQVDLRLRVVWCMYVREGENDQLRGMQRGYD